MFDKPKNIWIYLPDLMLEDCRFKPFIYLLWHDYFIVVYFKKVAIPVFNRNMSVLEKLPKDMAIKILDCQLNLMALVIGIVWNLREKEYPYILYQINRHIIVVSYSGPYCDINIKVITTTWYNLVRSRIQILSHENESHHTLTPILQQTINASKLTVECSNCWIISIWNGNHFALSAWSNFFSSNCNFGNVFE